MAKKATAGKSARSAATKKTQPGSTMDAAAFVDHLHKDKKLRAILKKGWDDVIAQGKKKGFKFSKQELHNHLKKKYNVTSMPEEDEPDTCLCI